MNQILTFIAAIVVTAVADVIWALYIAYVGERKEWHAATMASVIIFASGLNILFITENKWNLVGAIIGAFVGTYLTVKYKK